jgi:hypothetical protein
LSLTMGGACYDVDGLTRRRRQRRRRRASAAQPEPDAWDARDAVAVRQVTRDELAGRAAGAEQQALDARARSV